MMGILKIDNSGRGLKGDLGLKSDFFQKKTTELSQKWAQLTDLVPKLDPDCLPS